MALDARIRELGNRHQTLDRLIEDETNRPASDDIRLKEKAQAFDDEFVQLARSVYFQNDIRARVKKAINLALGSAYVEEKSYQEYGSGSGA